MYDVLIIGCGITGAATAYELSKYQLKVGILERENDVSMGTTRANSAILHAGYDAKTGSLMAKLNVRGSELAREICDKLDVHYLACGSLVLAFNEDDQRHIENLYENGQKNQVPDLKLLTAEEAKALEPNICDQVTGALSAPSASVCSPWDYCLAMTEVAVQNGVDLFLETNVEGIEPGSDGWTLHTNQGDFSASYIINAAGLEAQTLHQMVADPSFKIIPTRGEYFLLDKSEGQRASRVIFQCPTPGSKGVLVAPTVHGNLIVGPNSEPLEEATIATSPSGLAYVRTTAQKSIPSIAFNQSITNFAGVRAVADTGDFVIEFAAPGFLNLAGICSPGLTAAPAIAEYAVELLAEDGLTLDKKADYVDERRRVRFNETSLEEKDRLLEENPAYGRVICRCETVTEGEILDALKGPIPPKTVDGVKRRVNAGMGRCQGGFCGPRVVEILARELGLSPDAILKDGDGSWILNRQTKEEITHV